jgi:hypothetical protein
MCTSTGNIEYIGNTVKTITSSTYDACCSACHAAKTPTCLFFTFMTDSKSCLLKTDDAPDTSHPNPLASSGYVGNSPPAPRPPPVVTVEIDTSVALSQTLPNYLCWNIDASRNRQFFDRNLDPKTPFGKQVALQAAALAPPGSHSLLRFGGSGNDYLTYEFNGTQCPAQDQYKECMNQTW